MSHCFTSKDFVVKSFEKYKFYPFDQGGRDGLRNIALFDALRDRAGATNARMDDGKDESLHVAPNKPAYSSARTGLKHRAGVVSAGHAKMLNTVKDKNRGSQSDRARPSENITPRSSGPLSFRQSPAKAAKGARLKHSVLTGVRLSFDNIHLRKTWREREKERGREAHRH
jgi:hypothetical protein